MGIVKDRMISAEDAWLYDIAPSKGYICSMCGQTIQKEEYLTWSMRSDKTCDYCASKLAQD